jgi:hydrogenase-4 component B
MLEGSDLHLLMFTLMSAGYAGGGALPLLLNAVRRRSGAPPAISPAFLKNLGFSLSLVASIAGCVLASQILLSGRAFHLEVMQSPLFGPVAFRADGLSAIFLGIISLLAVPVSWYSFGYVADLLPRRNVGLMLLLYNGFLLSMVCVILAGHAVLFLFFWEAMSLATYVLINVEHEDPESRRAGFLYVVMTHIGTAFILAMFVALYAQTGSFSFEAFSGVGARLPVFTGSLLFLCATIGFGIKAGIIPFHIWLPEAHPAAPSNVSALMSGVMIKTGIYGMVRVYFDFLGPDVPEWWGILVLIIAVVSAVLGVLYALMEHDLKRLLAFHSIENIGIILMGVGGALLFSAVGNRTLAAVALLAGLYHVLNHATFKGLLFLGAGSVVHGTHSRNIEDLGGLIRTMPRTALFFLVGAAAISALPPLNGFVSEWLTFQALLLGFHNADLTVRIAVPLTVALLALTGALAAACFVKAFGITFLGIPRSAHAEHATESPLSMTSAMGVLALLCLLFGVMPGFVIDLLNPVVASLMHSGIPAQLSSGGGMVVVQGDSAAASIAPSSLFLWLLLLALVPLGMGVLYGGRLRKRVAMTWACGLERIEPQMQYSATGFSKPLRLIFSSIYRARHEIEVSEESSPYFQPQVRYELKTESVFLKYLYEPAVGCVHWLARWFRRIQTGRIQSYLAYIFIVLVLLLLFAR